MTPCSIIAAPRTRDSFHCAAYAVNAREMTLVLPLLARGWLPLNVDLTAWLQRSDALPKITTDARYVEGPCACYGPIADNIHGIDEWVDIDSMRAAAVTVAILAARWCTR